MTTGYPEAIAELLKKTGIESGKTGSEMQTALTDHAQVTNKPQTTGSTKQSSTLNSDTKEKIVVLFRLMKANYNHKYTSTFKTPDDVAIAMKLWAKKFGHVPADQLMETLDQCFDHYEWPPNAKEFKAHLKEVQARHAARHLRLTHTPHWNKELGKETIAKLKEQLR